MTISESYRQYSQGKINKAQFMERARKDHHLRRIVNNVMSFDDTIRTLKNRGIISESVAAVSEAPREEREEVTYQEAVEYFNQNLDQAHAAEAIDYLQAIMKEQNMTEDMPFPRDIIEDIAEEVQGMFEEGRAGEDGGFNAVEYIEQKYGSGVAQRIQDEILDNHGINGWDRFTAMEYAEEVDEYVDSLLDGEDPEAEDDDTWTDPAGGTHHDGPEFDDPAAMYAEAGAIGFTDKTPRSSIQTRANVLNRFRKAAEKAETPEDFKSLAAMYNKLVSKERKTSIKPEEVEAILQKTGKFDTVIDLLGKGVFNAPAPEAPPARRETDPKIQKLIARKDALVQKLKNGEITMNAYKRLIGKAPEKIKAYFATNPTNLNEAEIIPHQLKLGINWELGLTYEPVTDWGEDFVTPQDIAKVTKKVLKNLEKDPLYYMKLQGTGQKPTGKAPKEENIKSDGHLKKEVKKDEKANVQDTLGKKEKAKSKNAGIKVLKEGDYDKFGKTKTIRKPGFGGPEWGSRREPGEQYDVNSIDQVIAYLKDKPGATETDILRDVWGVSRKDQPFINNKKFAEMIRRGLMSKKIARATKKTGAPGRSQYFYYLPNHQSVDLPMKDGSMEESGFRPGVDLGKSFDKIKQTVDVDPEQLRIGVEVEKEHTSDPAMAEKIARDHLGEDPQYYTKLNAAGLEEEEYDLLNLHKDFPGMKPIPNPFGAGKPSKGRSQTDHMNPKTGQYSTGYPDPRRMSLKGVNKDKLKEVIKKMAEGAIVTTSTGNKVPIGQYRNSNDANNAVADLKRDTGDKFDIVDTRTGRKTTK